VDITTPVERYEVGEKKVYVKREDLCCPFPGPNNAKARGVYSYMKMFAERGVEKFGVLDTKISRSGWIVAWAGQELGVKVYDFYPVYKDDSGLRFAQKMAKAFGAELVGQRASMQWWRYYQAKAEMQKLGGHMLPDMLRLETSVDEVAAVVKSMNKRYLKGTVVISVGSGIMLAGLMKGLDEKGVYPDICAVLVTKGTKKRCEKTILQFVPVLSYMKIWSKLKLVDPGYEYLEQEVCPTPFPCDLYYDRKAWKWLVSNIDKLKEPILFWNIGGEWDAECGLCNGLRGDGIVTPEQVEEFLKEADKNVSQTKESVC